MDIEPLTRLVARDRLFLFLHVLCGFPILTGMKGPSFLLASGSRVRNGNALVQ